MLIVKNLVLIYLYSFFYLYFYYQEGKLENKTDTIILLSDFQKELGCKENFSLSCDKTIFRNINDQWQLEVIVPAGNRVLKISHNRKLYGQHGKLYGPGIHLILAVSTRMTFLYNASTHIISVTPTTLESRSSAFMMNVLTLDDTLLYDPNNNRVANPGDNIRYQMILKNQSGISMTGVNITRIADPNTTIDPNFLKASPLAFNDTFIYDTQPKNVIAAMGLLSNDYDLNDPLPNPPFNSNLTIVSVNSSSAYVGSNLLTTGGGHVIVNADGSFIYDSLGVNGAQTDTWMYTVLDADGFYDSAVVLMQFNKAPLIATHLSATDSICAFEQRDTFLVTTAFTIEDDEINAESANIQICSNYLLSEDTLVPGLLPGGMISMWNEISGTLILKGSTILANYETAIESIQYLNQSENLNISTKKICITVHDGSENSNQVIRELKIIPVNDCPSAIRDSLLITENGSTVAGNVLTADTDPENDALTVTMVNASSANTNVGINGGTLTIATSGTVTFTHTSGAMGLDTLNLNQLFFSRAQYTNSDGICADNDSVIIKITGINDEPVADSNKYSLAQNSVLTVSAPGILADDDDIDNGATIFVGEVNGSAINVGSLITLATGAELNVSSNGSFTYNPKCLVAGLDSFTYAVKDENNALSSTVKVYLQISQNMWFVDDVVTNGSGSFNSPFNSMASVESLSQAGDYVFLFPGTYSQNLTLKNNQKLIGADENWLCTSGSTIRNASGNSNFAGELTLAANDTVRGIDFIKTGPSPFIALESRSSGGSIFIKDNNASVGNLTMSNNTLTITSFARCGLAIRNGGNLNLSFDNMLITGNNETSINLNNCNGNMLVSTGSIVSTGDTLVNVKGGQISATFNNSFSQPSDFPLLTVTDHTVGILTFQTGALSATLGSGLQFNNADGNYNFNGTTTLNGGDAGIDIINGSNGNFTFLDAPITNTSGVALLVNGGNGIISHTGAINKSTTGRMIDIHARTGGSVTVNGNLSSTLISSGINVSSCTGGTVTFSGSNKTLNTPGNNPVNLTSNAGAAIHFTNGNLAITSASATGFNATGGGTITTQGLVNTIVSTTGTALNVENTTIGVSGLTFQSISSNGSVNGIVLNSTGASGGLSVTGTGTSNSGGTIQNTTSHGVLINSTINLSFNNLNIQNTSGSGLNGTLVTNFTFTNGIINSSGTSLGVETANIAFNTTIAGTENNLSGNILISGNTLSNAYYHGIDIFNFNGIISDVTISNNNITSSTSIATSKGTGIRLIGFGSATTVGNITKATINQNRVSNFPSGNGIMVQGGNAANAGIGIPHPTSPAGTYGTDAANPIAITNNTISGQSAANRIAAQGIIAVVNGKGTGFYTISNNSVSNTTGTSISVSSFGFATITAIITSNTLIANNTAGAQGIGAGTSQTWSINDNPILNVRIGNGTVGGMNNISQTDGNGILITARDCSSKVNARILTNTVAAPLSGNRNGIRIDAGNGISVDDEINLEISDNTSAGSGLSPEGIGLRKQGTVSTTNDFKIVGMVETNSPGIENYVGTQNLGSVLNGGTGLRVLLISATSGFSAGTPMSF